ncbi:oxygen-dependent protoporphyrinogen oxidase [Salix suchowensis]|nr:oxygen-dependent protoporphyrinogen oxidase [Salix suchowensis]
MGNLLAKALEGKNVKELLSNVGSGGGSPAAAPAGGAAAGAAAAEAPKEEEKKEEEKEESDDDMRLETIRASPEYLRAEWGGVSIIPLPPLLIDFQCRLIYSSGDDNRDILTRNGQSVSHPRTHHKACLALSFDIIHACPCCDPRRRPFRPFSSVPSVQTVPKYSHHNYRKAHQAWRLGTKRSDTTQGQHGRPCSVLLESAPNLAPECEFGSRVHLLGLKDSLVLTPRSAAAARKRFLYIYGTKGLTPLPSSVATLISSPLRSLFLRAGLRDTLIARQHRRETKGGLVFVRHFGRFSTDAGERARAWDLRRRFAEAERACGVPIALRGGETRSREIGNGRNIRLFVPRWAFDHRERTASAPSSKPNVRLLLGTGVSRLSIGDDVEVTARSIIRRVARTDKAHACHFGATTPPTPSPLAPSSLPHLDANPSSSVTVANFVFPPSSRFHPDGFGYLIPRPRAGYQTAENPGILGTVLTRVRSQRRTRLRLHRLRLR